MNRSKIRHIELWKFGKEYKKTGSGRTEMVEDFSVKDNSHL